MESLSALRVMINPGLRAAQGPFSAPAAALSKAISPVDLEQLRHSSGVTSVGPAESPGSFEKVLGNLVDEVSSKQAVAADAVNGVLTGQNVSLHQAMIAMEEASVSFQLMVEVRNKLLESYQELMRMQV